MDIGRADGAGKPVAWSENARGHVYEREKQPADAVDLNRHK